MTRPRLALAALASALLARPAVAAIKVGVIVSATGPGASLGISARNAVALLPASMGGVRVDYLVLDDATDGAAAARDARQLTGEDEVDVLVGSSTAAASLAMIEVAAETGTPMISLAAGARIVEPMDEKRRWVFKTPQSERLMAVAIVDHMTKRGVKSAAFIGFADAFGDGWWRELSKAAAARGISIVASERYDPSDESVTGQALKILSARPDAVVVGGAGTPAVLPQKTLVERGYRGLVYQTPDVATPDFLRAGGADVEGAFLAAGPVVVASQLPDSHPCKQAGLEFVQRYEAAHGPGSASSFAAHAWDAGLLLQAAIPVALRQAKPGTPEFRSALRGALEGVRDLRGAHGVFNLSPADHVGLDERARVMVRIEGGAWQLAP